ncbi:hypothetical protein BLNAU_14452 [Blattamonas nauphoetae]|uniref:Uncharacterized protein n=1 Tax=Blattamonas nauphoetae TaxID=2049346 RepID=A0ABQ9XDU6_9EUKA|nr:hypothetical protein BLNAU_14452 [Blattamonas nauphoetae]
MEPNPHSNQYLPSSSFNRDATPLFQRIEPDTITTVQQVSPPFMSLVDFVKEDNTLDDTATEQACAILKMLGLYQLVPARDGSWSGFAESFVLLLTSSNETLVKAILSLLKHVLRLMDAGEDRFFFLETGFFQLLPQSFYEQEVHLSSKHGLHLMQIVASLLYDLIPSSIRRTCEHRQLSTSTFENIFVDKFLRPINPFLVLVGNNRRQITDCPDSQAFPQFLGMIVKCSPYLQQTTRFVHYDLLESVNIIFMAWQKEDSTVQQRGKLNMAKLREEGLSDEIELYIRCSSYDVIKSSEVFLGAKLIHNLGGNAPFLG